MKGLFVSLLLVFLAANVAVASDTAGLKHVTIAKTSEARQRGAETVVSICLMCHSLKYLKYDDLNEIGMSNESIQGLMPGESMNDRMMSLTPADVRIESYGKLPPDLSLMAIARKGGAQYIYSLLTGYFNNDSGDADNHVFPGIAMPDVMGYSFTEAGSEDRAAIEAQAMDVAAFLAWAADPNAEERHTIGWYVISYLILFTILLYLVKRSVWRNLR